MSVASRKDSAAGRPIGVFDSGLGGLTVVRQLRRALPHEDFIYLGDTARVPYGTKSTAAVIQFSCEAGQFLMRQGVKAIVIACNTATAWGLPTLERRFPAPIFGVVTPGATAALRRSQSGRIGVIATPSTIRSGAYRKAIVALDDQAQVFSQACPLLVPLVEEGWQNHPVTRLVLQEYLAPLTAERIDTLVLGCTHYPLLKTAIRRVVGHRIALVDSAASCAADVRAGLGKQGLLVERRRRKGSFEAYVTDDTPAFAKLCSRLLRLPPQQARKAVLPPYEAQPSQARPEHDGLVAG
ncbi:MAG: glutamate racemase [Verrucomicrobia bacterium]|nr:glutamate racemase [Verrucomicrobiota bacterium]MBI3869736.1 glutamate racemase [Verrucomicrobiota bacterium]